MFFSDKKVVSKVICGSHTTLQKRLSFYIIIEKPQVIAGMGSGSGSGLGFGLGLGFGFGFGFLGDDERYACVRGARELGQ